MDKNNWLEKYFENYKTTLLSNRAHPDLVRVSELFLKAGANKKKLLFAGNGGSAAMSSHCAVDFTKLAQIRAVNFNEADLITCFGNDYGYENWVAKALEAYADPGDVVVLISSSGASANMVNAGKLAKQKGLALVTFTGFDANNPLRQLGDVNIWVDSHIYNVVENTHQTWLLGICDLIVAGSK